MATPVPLTAGFIVVDTTSVKTFQLPLSTDIVGRSITFKDRTGNAGRNNITIQTQGGDTFQGGSTSYRITQPYGSATFVSRNGQWVLDQGTELIYASSIFTNFLGVSTISVVNQISTPNLLTSTVTFVDIINAQRQVLAVSSGFLVLNGQAIAGGGVTQLIAGSNISLNPAGGTGVVTVNNAINPTGLVSTANLSGLVSTANLSGLVSTANLSGLVSTANLSGLVSTANLSGLVSTQNLSGLVSTANLSGLVSTPNLLNLVSTPFLNTSLVSTTVGLQTFVSSFIDPVELASTVANLISTTAFQNALTSTVGNLGQAGYVSTASLRGLVSTPNLMNLVSTQNLSGLVSTPNLQNLVSTANLSGLVSTPNLLNLVSTPFLNTSLVSTTVGLQTFISSFIDPVELASTVANLISTTALQTALASTVGNLGQAGYVSSASLRGLVSTPNLLNLVSTANLSGLVSTPNLLNLVSTPFLNTSLVSTTVGLQTFVSSFIDPVELASTVANLISTTLLQTALASTVGNLGQAGYVSSASLRGFVSTPNLLNLVSTANLSGLVSTPNLLNLVSTPFFDTRLVSTVVNLGSLGYVSTAGLINTVVNLGSLGYVSTASLVSTVANLGSLGYVSTASLVSTVAGLGRIYASTTSLISTVGGLGSAGYVSSSQLVSTTFGITSNYSSFFSTTLSGYSFPYSGAELYLNYSLSVPPYQQLGISNIIGPSYSDVFPITANTSNIFVTGFQSDFFLPSFLQTGLWTTTLFAEAEPTGVSVYVSLFDRTPGGVESVIATSSNSPQIVPLTKVAFDLTVDVPYYNISSGNTLVLKIFANNTANQPRTLITYYENGNYSHVDTTLSQVVAISYITSTIAGLGTLGYVSSSQLVSTVAGLGTAGYVSTSYLQATLVSSVQNWSIYPAISTIVLSTASARIVNCNIAGVITVETSNVIFSDLSGNPAQINAGIVGFDYVSPSKPFHMNQVEYYTKSPDRALGLYDMDTVNTGSLYLSTIYFGDISGTIQGQLTTDPGATNLYWNDVPFVNETSLVSTASNWSIYPAISSIHMTGLNPTIINGSDELFAPLQLQTKFLLVADSNFAPGIISHGLSIFATSTNNTVFVLGNDTNITGTVSSLGLGYSDGSTIDTGSLYLSSMYLGGIGGSVYGQLTTNGTATDLFWNGSSLVGGGGGDVTTGSLASTVAGLGQAGYVSTANLIGLISTPNILNLVSTSYLASQLASTVGGLGRAGYISSLSTLQLSTGSLLTRNVALTDINNNNQNILTTSSGVLLLNGQGIGSGGGGGGASLTVSDFLTIGRLAADQNLTADVDNDIQFIDEYDPQNWYNSATYKFQPTIGGYYLITFQLWFSAGAVSDNQWNIQIQKNDADSFTLTQVPQVTYTGASANATKIIFMNGSTDTLRFRAYVGNTSNTTAKAQQGTTSGSGTFFTAALLTNGSSGAPLFSTVAGLGQAGYISTAQLTSTTAGLVLPINLYSTVAGLGAAGYVSTSRLAGLVSTPNLQNLVSTANLSGLVSTPNLANLVSTANLQNLVSTANLIGLVSTQNLIGLVSSPNLLNLVSTPFLNTSLVSTTVGLQSFISSFIDPVELASTVANLISTTALQTALASTVGNLGQAGYVSSASLRGLVSTQNLIGLVSTPNLANLVSTANLIGLVSTQNLIGLVSTPNLLNLVSTPFLNTSLVSTTIGLQTFISSFIDPVELASTVANLISTTSLQTALASTVGNLGQAGYVSSASLRGLVSTPNLTNLVSTANLSGLISTPNLANLVSTANLIGLISTPNLLNLVSTSFLNTSLVSTTLGLQTFISSFIDPVELASTVANLISSTALQTALASTVGNLGQAGYVSSASLRGFVSTPNLVGLISTPNLANLVSTANLVGLVSTQNLIGLVSTPNLLNVVSTPFLNTSLVSTTVGLQTFISSFIDPVELASTVANLISTTALQNALASTVGNLGQAGYVSSASLRGLVSTQNLIGLVSTPNLVNLVSTANLSGLVSTQNLIGLVSTQNLIGLVSTPNLANLVSTPNLLNLVSTANLIGLVSTPNLLNLVSTSFLNSSLVSTTVGLQTFISSFIDPVELASTVANLISTTALQTALASTVGNLGQAGYVSSASLIGLVSTANLRGLVSTPNLANLISTPNLLNLVSTANLSGLVSTANLQNLVSTPFLNTSLVSTTVGLQTFISSFIDPVELASTVANLISTTALQTALASTVGNLGQAGYVSSASLIGIVSTANLSGLVSTPNLQNLVSTSYLETQLTSTIQNWSKYPAISSINMTGLNPTIINGSDDVEAPLTLQSRFLLFEDSNKAPGVIFHGLSVFGTSTNNTVFILGNDNNITGTVSSLGLGYSDGPTIDTGSLYLSSMYLGGIAGSIYGQLTTNGTATDLFWNGSSLVGGGGDVTTGSLASTVAGLGQAGYVSTANLSGLVSTPNLSGLLSAGSILNVVSTANLSGLVSTPNLLNLVSTTYLASQLASTIIGLSNVAVTQIIAGSNISISPSGGIGAVTINGNASGLLSIPANLSTSAFFTSTIDASTVRARVLSTGVLTTSSVILFDPLSANALNTVTVASTFLYFNSFIIGGTRVAQPQWVVF